MCLSFSNSAPFSPAHLDWSQPGQPVVWVAATTPSLTVLSFSLVTGYLVLRREQDLSVLESLQGNQAITLIPHPPAHLLGRHTQLLRLDRDHNAGLDPLERRYVICGRIVLLQALTTVSTLTPHSPPSPDRRRRPAAQGLRAATARGCRAASRRSPSSGSRRPRASRWVSAPRRLVKILTEFILQ